MSEMRATPQNPWWGVPANLLKKGLDFAEAPFGYANPPVKLLNDMGPRGLQRILEKKSYGVPVLGKTNEPLVSDDLMDAAGFMPPAKLTALAAPALMGAIRIGGKPGNMLSHAFNPTRAKAIADEGKLISPSLGITHESPNDYGPNLPQFIFKAGATDVRPQNGTLLNRDGYFSNPTGLKDNPAGDGKVYDIMKHQADIVKADDKMSDAYAGKDWRLGQGLPGASHTLSIAASPSFKSFAEFEAHPNGQGALERFSQLDGENQPEWAKVKYMMSRLGVGEKEAVDMYRSVNTGHTPENWPQNMQNLWRRASESPSAMAELKLRENLPVSPENAFIHVPDLQHMNPQLLESLMPLRDKGFRFVPERELGPVGGRMGELARIATPEGTFAFPPQIPEAPGTPWGDFLAGKNPREEHFARLRAKKYASGPVFKESAPPNLLTPKFANIKEAEDWIMDSGDEVMVMLDEAKDAQLKHAAALTDEQELGLMQSVADLAHSHGFMDKPFWHAELQKHAEKWLQANVTPVKHDVLAPPKLGFEGF